MGIRVAMVNQDAARSAAVRDVATASTNLTALEQGGIVTATGLCFQLSEAEQRLLSPKWLEPKAKNISFDPHTGTVRGTTAEDSDFDEFQRMFRRFSGQARDLMIQLFPPYRDQLQVGLASFRPAEVTGRVSTWRKDDTRLHVDAFPSRPVQGRRIMRLFVNVGDRARRWHVGEPFEQVARKFLPRIGSPRPGSLWLLEHLHVTRGRRTLYDHFMIGLHDAMKADADYQKSAGRTEVEFQPGAIWTCYTDVVSHAALSGQFALEQTFYLPVSAMQDSAQSPLRILERILGRPLA